MQSMTGLRKPSDSPTPGETACAVGRGSLRVMSYAKDVTPSLVKLSIPIKRRNDWLKSKRTGGNTFSLGLFQFLILF